MFNKNTITGLVALLGVCVAAACSPTPDAADYDKIGGGAPRDSAFPASSQSSAQAARPAGQAAQATSAAPATDTSSVKPLKVALLLPLSGQHAKLGQAMLDASLLAIEDQRKRGSLARKIIFVPKDSGADQATALAAINSLESAAPDVIVGPVFSTGLQALDIALSQGSAVANKPILSFSNNASLARKNRYLLGFDPRQQVSRVVEYAADKEGRRKIAALLPNDAYGKLIEQSLRMSAERSGISVAAIEFYPAGAVDLSLEIEALFGMSAMDNAIPSPQYNFDALLLPEGGERLRNIVQVFNRLRVDQSRFQILGSGQWDDDTTLYNETIDSAVYPGSEPEKWLSFRNHFKNTYGYTPPRLASISYDAASLVNTVAIRGQDGFDAQFLLNPSGFYGPVDGLFRLRSDGLSERGLAVLSPSIRGPELVERQPRTFSSN